MDQYFDFHFHPVSKNHLVKYPKKRVNDLKENTSKTLDAHGERDVNAKSNTTIANKRPEEKKRLLKEDLDRLANKIEMSKGFMDVTDEVVLRMLESQSCVDHLKKGKVALGVAAISALEFGIASSKGFFSDLMKTGYSKPFDQKYFDVVREGEVSYLNLFLKEVEQYLKLSIRPKKEGALNFLKRDRPKAKALAKDFPNLVLCIEGGHNLSSKKIGNALEYDEFKEFNVDSIFYEKTRTSEKPHEVLRWLYRELHGVGIDIFCLTLTHLTHIPEQHLATHAFGTRMLKHPSFYPFGNGLSELGKKVIDAAYGGEESKGTNKKSEKGKAKKNKVPPILIDIKHLSLKSRKDLYEYRKPVKGRETNYEDIPLIASHAGVTGYSVNDWKDNLEIDHCTSHVDQGIKTIKIRTKSKVAGYWGSGNRTEFTFNPNTINLMDEDIIEIVKSNGLIGVGLDVHLLGSDSDMADIDYRSEFVSTSEFAHHFPYTGINALNFTDSDEIKAEEKWLKPTRKVMHPLSLCFNIVHIMAVINLKTAIKDEDSKKYICIGSDFDGFIEPLKVCGGSEHMKELEANLLKWLPVAARRYQEENGGADDLFKFTRKKQELEKVVKAILYENGHRFLKERGYFVDVVSTLKEVL